MTRAFVEWVNEQRIALYKIEEVLRHSFQESKGDFIAGYIGQAEQHTREAVRMLDELMHQLDVARKWDKDV